MTSFAVLVPVGPAPTEIARLADLVDSLVVYEPQVRWVVLIDDAVPGRPLDQGLRLPPGCQAVVLPNPRRGRGQGWAGGNCSAVIEGLAWIRQNTDCAFALKVDTDTLFIGPFAEQTRRRFAESPDVGMLGSYELDPNGSARPTSSWNPTLKTFLSPVALRGKHIQVTLWGDGRHIKEALQKALSNGYQFGEHCQGGGMAMSAELLRLLAREGYLDKPLAWLPTGLTDDIMMGVLTRSVGMKMADFNHAGEPFGVQHIGLAYAPQDLIDRGYAIIHSIKDHAGRKEEDVRRFFRECRAACCQSAS